MSPQDDVCTTPEGVLFIDKRHTEDVAYVGHLSFAALDRGPSLHAGMPLSYVAIPFYLARHDHPSLRAR